MQEDMHFIFCSCVNSRINNVDLKIVGKLLGNVRTGGVVEGKQRKRGWLEGQMQPAHNIYPHGMSQWNS